MGKKKAHETTSQNIVAKQQQKGLQKSGKDKMRVCRENLKNVQIALKRLISFKKDKIYTSEQMGDRRGTIVGLSENLTWGIPKEYGQL